MLSLYQRVLGPNYEELAHGLRAFHAAASGGRARGRMAVEHGPTRIARRIAWLAGMPEEASHADVILVVTVEQDHEIWDRTFGSRPLRTTQRAWQGLLLEATGPLVLGFELLVEHGGIDFIHRRTWLFGVPLPAGLAPRANAKVTPAGERWKIDVRLALPLIGPLIRYHGYMAPASPEGPTTKHQKTRTTA